MAEREEQVEFGGWLVTVLALLALLALTGCEKKPSDPPQPRSGAVVVDVAVVAAVIPSGASAH